VLAGFAGIVAVSNAIAQGGPWSVEVTPYFWLAQLDGEATVRGFEIDFDQDLSDAWDLLVDNFNLGGAVHLEAHNGQWGMFGDAMYLSLESEVTGPVFGQEIDVEFNQFVAEFGGFYRLIGADPDADGSSLRPHMDLLAGARVNDLDLEVNPESGATRDRNQTWIDPFVGVRGEIAPAEWLTFFARGDIGGFGIDEGTTSDLVWNIEAGVRFNMSRNAAINLGYRWLDTDFEDGDDDFEYDLMASGPFLSFRLRL
jgi:hypothetical protein